MKFDYTKNPMWLSKEVGIHLCDWCLCLTDEALQKVQSQLQKEGRDFYLKFPTGGAECKFVYRDSKLTDCIVCLVETDDPVENAVSLVHEAVHIWQGLCEYIGEENPSKEFEAYTIQNITQRLFDAYKMALEQREK